MTRSVSCSSWRGECGRRHLRKDKPNVFSSFPPLGDRIQAMRKEIAEILPKRNGAVVSTPEFKDFQERVRAWKPGLSESKQPDEKH